jgi:hypothetical protein
MHMVRRVVIVIATVIAGMALLQGAQGASGPDFDYLWQAVVSIGGAGAIFGPEKLIVATIHGSGMPAPGTRDWVALVEYARARGYKPPMDVWSADDPYSRPVTFVCGRRDKDVGIWKPENLPEDIPSLPLGRGFTGELYVLPRRVFSTKPVRARFIGYNPAGVQSSRGTQSARGPLPQFEIDGIAIWGWSGSPIVNWKGELVAMLLGGDESGRIIAAAPSELFRCP